MLKKLNHFLFGSPEQIGFDNYLVLVICCIISVVGAIGTAVNFMIDIGAEAYLSTLAASVVLGAVYLYSRLTNKYILSKYFLIILSLVIINIQWNVNFGTHGPILYLFVVIQSFIVLLFKKWERTLFTLMVLINVTVLFAIELFQPDFFGNYSDHKSRIIDLYWGMLIYLSLCIILIGIAMDFYIRQKEKAQQADKLKSSFLANMSHEIRTPMNAIIGFGQLLNATPTDETQKEYIRIINENSYHLLSLIDDIIDFSIIEANQVKIIPHDFHIYELLDDVKTVISKFLERYDKQDLQLVCNHPPENFMIFADYSRLKQVLTNLLSNAVKFTEKGSIIFGGVRSQESLTFYVQDSGIGIRKEDLPGIFKRFGKIENSNNEKIFRGTGIGLSISRQLIELMNGRIWVDSEPGKGSKFSFCIPIGQVKPEGYAESDDKPHHHATFTGELVLIAEDDDNNYFFLETILRRNRINTLRAKDGIEAVNLCKTEKNIRVVLMDIKMPRMDGFMATRIIKQDHPEIKIIAQTAYAMKTDEQQCLEAGCDDYIAKPVNTQELLDKIQKMIS